MEMKVGECYSQSLNSCQLNSLQCVRLSGQDKHREFLWVWVITELESGLYGPWTVCECALCCCWGWTESAELSYTGWKRWLLLNTTVEDSSKLRNPFSLQKMCHCGTHPLMGAPLNPILSWRHIRAVQVSVSQSYYHLHSPKSIFYWKTNLPKYLSLPLEY